ncbi:MAG: 2-hydroxyacid dehydrogenase [Pirellulales bacterium]
MTPPSDPSRQFLPRVVADGPLDPVIVEMLAGQVELLPWSVGETGGTGPIDAIYTYGHLPVDGPMMDRLPGLKVISNYGVGVDHIDLRAAADRGIPVGNTPGVLDGATADMGFALLLASARLIVAGDHYAKGPDFLTYDPGYMLGREVHGQTLGIVGLGRIGRQVAKRARGFDMPVLYHNRRPRPDWEAELGVQYRSFDDLLRQSDYVMLTCPLTAETRGLIGTRELSLMKPTATLINIARGGVVETAALTEALKSRRIAAAGLDVTDPEPLPRGHALLSLDNAIIVPHLGSATHETRTAMARLSVDNLLAGLRGDPLLVQIKA